MRAGFHAGFNAFQSLRSAVRPLTLLVGALVALPGLLGASPAATTSGFRLWLDPLTLGVLETDVDTDSAKFEEYRDLGTGFRLPKLRIFNDDEGKMNHSVLDTGGEVLVISQFTLYGEAARGNRPSYSDAARPEQAESLVARVAERIAAQGIRVATGRFGADMDVRLLNQGPVTILIDV